MRNDLHKVGSSGVLKLLALVPEASKSTDQRSGDVVLDGRYIEVKTTADVTVAQVRAVKYIPLVVHQSARDEWYVIPAHELVQLVASKKRGQHTENPLECALLSCPKPDKTHWVLWQRWRVQPQLLAQALREAYASSDAHPQIERLMNEQVAQTQALYAQAQSQVTALLGDLSSSPAP